MYEKILFSTVKLSLSSIPKSEIHRLYPCHLSESAGGRAKLWDRPLWVRLASPARSSPLFLILAYARDIVHVNDGCHGVLCINARTQIFSLNKNLSASSFKIGLAVSEISQNKQTDTLILLICINFHVTIYCSTFVLWIIIWCVQTKNFIEYLLML